VLLEKASSGGNAVWKCKYCSLEYRGSYSRVKSHLLRITGGGIKICPKVTKSVLGQLKNEVAKAADDTDKSKPKDMLIVIAMLIILFSVGTIMRSGSMSVLDVTPHTRTLRFHK